MGNIQIPNLPAATSLSGAEQLEIVQAGVSRRTTVGAIGSVGLGVYTVSTLPTATAGFRAFVSDASSSTFASVPAGGGSTFVPVYFDGTNWRIG